MNIKIVIEMGESGVISVNGPLANKMLCYGMIEAARDAIKDHNDKEKANRIIPPTNGDVLSLSRS